MTPPSRLRPVPRRRVLGTLIVSLAALSAMIWMLDSLRHPLSSEGPAVPELDVPAADPRAEVVCDDPAPREGQERDEPSAPERDQVATLNSNHLYDCPQTYSGRVVRYRGEVVGAVLRRGDGAWVQLNDDVYAEALGPLPTHRDFRGGNAGIGVLIPHELADQIQLVGGPKARGDVLDVVGVFHRVDPATHEVAVIHAESGTVASPGERLEDPLLADRLVAAALLVPAALAVAAAERVIARRRIVGGSLARTV